MGDDTVDPVEAAIDIIARYILWQITDIESVSWEDYRELGEHDFDRILDRVEELSPPCPDLHDRQDAYEFLAKRGLQ